MASKLLEKALISNDEEINFPPFLQGEEKWNFVVQQTNTLQKFESLMYRLLEDEYLSPIQFYNILKKLENDVIAKHNILEVKTFVNQFEGLLEYIGQLINRCQTITNEKESNGKKSTP